MELVRIHYYFSVEGRRGGLFSLEFKFLPQTEQNEPVQEALKQDFKTLESLLDRVLLGGRGWSFEKTPIFSDSPHSTRVGYEYRGSWKSGPLGFAKRLIESFLPVFGKTAWSNWPGPFHSLTCILHGTVGKMQAGEMSLELRLTLYHKLNCLLLKQVLALPGLSVAPKAKQELEKLERLLALHREDPERLLEFWGE